MRYAPKVFFAASILLVGCEYQLSGCDGPVCVNASSGESSVNHQCSGYAGCASVCPAESVVDESLLREVTLARRLYTSCASATVVGFPNMTFDPTLDAAAYQHAADMATHHFESVFGSDGLAVGDRVAAIANRDFSLDNHLAQLVASGAEDARGAVSFWLDNPAYCEQLLSADYSFLGAACVSDGQRSRWSLVLGGS